MVSGYVSQIKTLKSTGDIVLAVEVTRDALEQCVKLHLEKVIILTEGEYVDLMDKKEQLMYGNSKIDVGCVLSPSIIHRD